MEQIIENVIDVRLIEPMYKHSKIFERFDSLKQGESLLIINDHDPKPLYYQLLAERGNIFEWSYEENGPEVWQVKIKRRIETKQEYIGEIAAKDFRKAQVFKKYGIDFCCGGKKTIEEVCAEKGIDQNLLKVELDKSPTTEQQVSISYNDFSLDFMCDYIVNTHHQYVRQTLPMLVELGEKVSRKHSDRFPELTEIYHLIVLIDKELMLHMYKEEQVLFPFIKKLVHSNEITIEGVQINSPIAMMEMEHESVGLLFQKISSLTNNYTIPSGACNSFSLLYNSLKEFYDDLILHIHLENNILFPKTLALLK